MGFQFVGTLNTCVLVISAVVLLLLVVMVSRKAGVVIRPDSSCAHFSFVVDATLARPDLDSIDPGTRGELCRIPNYMLQHGTKCPDRDWRDVSVRLRCDTAADHGVLGPEGITVTV